MTSAHILYIPTIFVLGFLAGNLFDNRAVTSATSASPLSGRILLGAFLVFAVVFIGTHFFEIPRSSKAVTVALNGAEIFDKKPPYSSDEVYQRISTFPPSGVYLYKEFTHTIDVLFPVSLFAFLFLLSRVVIQRHRPRKAFKVFITLLPILWFLSDMIENSVIYYLLDEFPIRHDVLAGFLGGITISKFTLLLLSFLMPVSLIAFSKKVVSDT